MPPGLLGNSTWAPYCTQTIIEALAWDTRPSKTGLAYPSGLFSALHILAWMNFLILKPSQANSYLRAFAQAAPHAETPPASLNPYSATYRLDLFAYSLKTFLFPSWFPVNRTNYSSSLFGIHRA